MQNNFSEYHKLIFIHNTLTYFVENRTKSSKKTKSVNIRPKTTPNGGGKVKKVTTDPAFVGRRRSSLTDLPQLGRSERSKKNNFKEFNFK